MARDFVAIKTGRRDSIDIQQPEEFQTSKFYGKIDFDKTEISKGEEGYVTLPKFYTFPSKEASSRARLLRQLPPRQSRRQGYD